MYQKTHHIPILAGFEIEPSPDYQPLLDRAAAQDMAHALAADLARLLPETLDGMLVVGGLVVEPASLLRPGFDAWTALSHLAKPILTEQGLNASVMAIGAHDGQMPDDRLQPNHAQLMGQFVVLPMLLITDEASGPALEKKLEAELFESGSINPPARALLAEHARLDSVHGQLLTRNDLLALQRVQLDTAGLSGFWSVIETILLDGGHDHRLSLPADVSVCWKARDQVLEIEFLTFNQWAADHAKDADEMPLHSGYGLWVRAYRTLLAIVESHGIGWVLVLQPGAVFDEQRACVIESIPTPQEAIDRMATLTEHADPSLGLIAWTWAEPGRLIHLYPIEAKAIGAIKKDFQQHPLATIARPGKLCYNDDTLQLTGV